MTGFTVTVDGPPNEIQPLMDALFAAWGKLYEDASGRWPEFLGQFPAYQLKPLSKGTITIRRNL